MYDSFYGLSARPFQLTPDPRFYFESATHRKALSYLGYGLAQGEGFIVITGEIGAGKTTLVGHLRSTIDPSRLTVAQIVTTQLGGNELLFAVARSFGIETSGMDKPAVLQSIEQYLHAEARAGRRCLLIVDETQNLDVKGLEELRMLSNFQLGATPLLQIFLLGQPEFRNMLRTSTELEQLRQRVIATHHLEGMERSELRGYIEHRLRKVGWHGRPGFDSDMIAALYDETDGVPRKVNNLVNRVLLLGAIQQANRITTDMLQTVLADLSGDNAALHQTEATEAAPEIESQLADTLKAPAAKISPSPVPVAEAFPSTAVSQVEEVTEEAVDLSELSDDAKLFEIARKAGEFDACVKATAPSVVQMPVMTPGQKVEKVATPEPVVDELAAPLPEAQDIPEAAAVTDAERLERLEARIAEQERAVRRTISMLIEWLESDKMPGTSRHRAA